MKSYRKYCPINRNCWAILTDQRANDIRDFLGGVLSAEDRLFIIRSGVEAAWFNSFGPKNSAWLKKHL